MPEEPGALLRVFLIVANTRAIVISCIIPFPCLDGSAESYGETRCAFSGTSKKPLTSSLKRSSKVCPCRRVGTIEFFLQYCSELLGDFIGLFKFYPVSWRICFQKADASFGSIFRRSLCQFAWLSNCSRRCISCRVAIMLRLRSWDGFPRISISFKIAL